MESQGPNEGGSVLLPPPPPLFLAGQLVVSHSCVWCRRVMFFSFSNISISLPPLLPLLPFFYFSRPYSL